MNQRMFRPHTHIHTLTHNVISYCHDREYSEYFTNTRLMGVMGLGVRLQLICLSNNKSISYVICSTISFAEVRITNTRKQMIFNNYKALPYIISITNSNNGLRVAIPRPIITKVTANTN